jgi:TolB-like protein
MASAGAPFTLNLLGAFQLLTPGGERVEVSSRKGVALMALLAMAHKGEHTRGWLQDKLWGSRQSAQARASLRRELSNLRKALNAEGAPLLICERDRVRLDLDRLRVDAREADAGGARGEPGGMAHGEFLEGIDLASEDGFEDWLREQRVILRQGAADARSWGGRPIDESANGGLASGVAPGPPLPSRIVDVSQPAPGFGGRPALAVLPFVNMTGESANDYLAEGISEDLIDRLSKLRWLPVIARSSSFAFSLGDGDGDGDHRAAGEELGAKYLLGGRLRAAGDDFSVTASLTEAATGQVLLSHRLHLGGAESPAAIEALVAGLVAVLDAGIDHAEQARAHAKPRSDLNVNDLIWRGRWHLNRFTREDSRAARRLFAEALALEPDSPEALIQSTFCLAWSIWAERKTGPQIGEMLKLAQRAMIAVPEDSRGHMLAGVAELWLRRPHRAKTLLAQAISLNPSLALAHAELGSARILAGEAAEAIEPLKTALRLSPNDQQVFYILGEIAMAHAMLGELRQAVDHADQSLIHRAAYWYAHVIKINALARSGDLEGTGAALDELMTVKPDFEPAFVEWLPFMDGAWTDWLKDGLAMATAQSDGVAKNDLAAVPG